MAYNAVSQRERDVSSDSASNHSLSPDLLRETTSRPLSVDFDHSPKSTKMSNASRGIYTPLQHPTPGLESLQGAYISNIERLEQSAERLSQSGSDIGEELRKLKLEQKLSESRRASLYGRQNEDDEVFSPPSRQFSYPYGSHASNSIVGTNSIARSGGFSPSAYVASPRSSIRSGSWSHHNSIRGRSNSNGLRLTQLAEPEVVNETHEPPVLENLTPILPPQSSSKVLRVINHEESGLGEVDKAPVEGPPPPENADYTQRPSSTDTFQQANDLFEDFDGVHIPSQSAEHSVNGSNEGQDGLEQPPAEGRPKSEIDLLPDRPMSYMQPIADENMVYYPAPVPMMLNLPQRLSKLPSAPHRDKRRSEMLSDLQPESRKSAPRLPHPFGEEDDQPPVVQQEESSPRRTDKRRTMANMPPQLRASVFFDYPSVHQEVELKDGSAVATLDSILDASAYAPVSAFTDHPIVGQVGPEVYGRALPSYRASNMPPASATQKRRSSLNLLRRNSSSNMLDGTRPRTSSMMSLGKFGQRRSNPLAGDEAAAASLHSEETPLQVADSTLHLGGVDVDDDEFHDAQQEQDGPADGEEGTDDEVVGQPTTLLAELLLRQKEQKLRNRQAATAFPNGMHSTLLEMDAVAQVQKRTREKKHVQLAWEDPHGGYGGPEEEDDEDVPLGMLYPTQKLKPTSRFGRTDEDRPLGLIARRQLEDNETLSQRRARLKGVTPIARNPNADRLASMYTLDLPDLENREQPADPEEVEGETLAERMKRLKNKQQAQVAGTTPSRPISGEFASEVMSQFGGLEPEPTKDNKAKPPKANIISPSTIVSPNSNEDTPVEETLGQRRRRLQAEREARSRDVSGGSIVPTPPPAEPDRPAVSKRHSMADILSAHPAAGASLHAVSNSRIPLQPLGAPTHRQTSWARNQQRKFSSNGGGMPMAAGIGVPNPLAYSAVGEKAPLPGGGTDARKGDMIDRWRQSVLY